MGFKTNEKFELAAVFYILIYISPSNKLIRPSIQTEESTYLMLIMSSLLLVILL